MTQITRNQLDPFISCCIGRSNDYAFQLRDGRYLRAGTQLAYDELFAHLQGRSTLGTYVITEQNLCRFAVFDSDAPTGLFDLAGLNMNLAQWHPVLSGAFAAWCSPVGLLLGTDLTHARAGLAAALLPNKCGVLPQARSSQLGASWFFDPFASRHSLTLW